MIEDFVEAACALARDRGRLAALKTRLPAMLRRSPIMDEAGFVAGLEALYREMWLFAQEGHERRVQGV
jgi:predicted O-linked N-acetylglucosamine transferase (SPINDLY family)